MNHLRVLEETTRQRQAASPRLTWLALAVFSTATGCATTERVIGTETTRKKVETARERSFDVLEVIVEVQKAGVESRDLSARMEVDREASRFLPEKGAAPGVPTWGVLRITLSNKAHVVRDFDVVVAFQGVSLQQAPVARTELIEEKLLELTSLPTLTMRAGVSQVIGGNRIAMVRVWPGIDTTLFVKLVPSAAEAGADLSGFVGLFDAQSASGGAMSSTRLEFKARTVVRSGLYWADVEEEAEMTIELVATESFGEAPVISRRKQEGSQRTVSRKEPAAKDFRLVRLKDAGAQARPAQRGEPVSPGTPALPVAAEQQGPCKAFRAGVTHVRLKGAECSMRLPNGNLLKAKDRSVWSIGVIQADDSSLTISGSDGTIANIDCGCAEPL